MKFVFLLHQDTRFEGRRGKPPLVQLAGGGILGDRLPGEAGQLVEIQRRVTHAIGRHEPCCLDRGTLRAERQNAHGSGMIDMADDEERRHCDRMVMPRANSASVSPGSTGPMARPSAVQDTAPVRRRLGILHGEANDMTCARQMVGFFLQRVPGPAGRPAHHEVHYDCPCPPASPAGRESPADQKPALIISNSAIIFSRNS